MTRILFTISEEHAIASENFDEVFLWTDNTQKSTFNGPLKPLLHEFGQVQPLNSDFVRIALAVLAADRSVLREGRGSKWNKRHFDVTITVTDPVVWNRASARLSQVIGFLTGDTWSFTFEQSDPLASEKPTVAPETLSRVVLLSGGADSATGALMSRHDLSPGESQVLISQFSQNATARIQKNLASEIERLVPGRSQTHHQMQITRKSRRPDGTKFKDERSTRSRSMLFLALGLARASSGGVPLWIPENGFASLNPPLGPERRGSLSTKTTHPKFLGELRELLIGVGAHGDIVNPYSLMTKGEMFRSVADTFGSDVASKYLSQTNSCSHSDGRFARISPGSSCGVCFGCIVRRASFRAANLTDRTEYLSDDPTNKHAEYLEGKSIEIAMRDFIAKGANPTMVMAMDLPDDYRARDAYDLCVRGIAELAEYFA